MHVVSSSKDIKIIEYNGCTFCRWTILDTKSNKLFYRYVSPRVNKFNWNSTIHIEKDSIMFEENVLEELYYKYNKAISDESKDNCITIMFDYNGAPSESFCADNLSKIHNIKRNNKRPNRVVVSVRETNWGHFNLDRFKELYYKSLLCGIEHDAQIIVHPMLQDLGFRSRDVK